jgi:hypothetical protein
LLASILQGSRDDGIGGHLIEPTGVGAKNRVLGVRRHRVVRLHPSLADGLPFG